MPDYDAFEKKVGSSKWFIVLVIVVGVGIILTGYYTVTNEYVSTNKRVISHEGKDIYIILTFEDNLQVPLQTYANHKTSTVWADMYFKHIPIFVKSVRLSSNGSSILTVMNPKFDDIGGRAGVYKATVETGHPLEVGKLAEQYYVNVFYRNRTDTGPIIVETVPFVWNINTLDFGKTSYFWIIFLGVLISRVFSFTKSTKNTSTEFDIKELLWVPFSAVITLLIFSSFREQIQLTTDVMTNLALAFGFGFGFDKVFEVWHKAPEKGK